LLKLLECRHLGEGRFGQSSYHFYNGGKSLIHSSSYSIFGICGGRGLVENVEWGEGLTENVKYRHMGEGV